MRGAIVQGGDAERPEFVATGLGNPDATDGLGPGIQVKAVAYQEWNQAAVVDKIITNMPEIVRALASGAR